MDITFQSLKGLILTLAPPNDYVIYNKFQSLKGLILTPIAINEPALISKFQSLKGLILTEDVSVYTSDLTEVSIP